MIRTDYYCNTCGEKVRSGDETIMQFLGYLVDVQDGTPGRLRVVPVERTSKHVCRYCLVAFAAMPRDPGPDGPAKAEGGRGG